MFIPIPIMLYTGCYFKNTFLKSMFLEMDFMFKIS